MRDYRNSDCSASNHRNSDYSTSIKNKKAIALQHAKNSGAPPMVVALGAGYTAESIIKIAEFENIPIHEDADLAHFLSFLDISEYIPVEVYSAVAKILAYVYEKDKN